MAAAILERFFHLIMFYPNHISTQEIYHCRRQIKYSKDKMWYLAKLIRGMSIDQALAQLEFSDKKGAQIIKEILLEAQDMAVRDHNVEFRSNLYIAESTSGRGQYLKRIRYHGRGRFGIMEKVFCHYFVKLVEGPPPPREAPKTAVTHAKEYIQELRNRTIIHTLCSMILSLGVVNSSGITKTNQVAMWTP
ncbi:hypothetical protein GH733_004943 [Mirounga leonina]|nr:hypothetical protein GH733_004943 [Mirounga leonina]